MPPVPSLESPSVAKPFTLNATNAPANRTTATIPTIIFLSKSMLFPPCECFVSQALRIQVRVVAQMLLPLLRVLPRGHSALVAQFSSGVLLKVLLVIFKHDLGRTCLLRLFA